METQVKITEKDGWVRVLDIEVPVGVVEAAFEEVTAKYKAQAEVPGFRAGKAPIEMVRARFRQAIRQDTLEQLLPEAFEHAIRQNNLVPLGEPAISHVVFEQHKPFTFTAEITIRPTIEVTGYKGLTLKRQVWEVGDEDVNRTVNRFRDVKAELIEVTRPVREGDVVLCDLQKLHDKYNRVKASRFENQAVELVEDRCEPEFFKQLPGMKIGEGKEIEVTYAPDYPEADFAGNTLLFRVWVKAVHEKKLPLLDDDFARSLGDFRDLADLKEKVRADLERNARRESEKDLREQARKGVVEANRFEVPRTLLQEYLDSLVERFKGMSGKMNEERLREEFRPLAEEQFRWDFCLHEIARQEQMTISPEELAAGRKAIQESRRRADNTQEAEMDDDRLRTGLLEQKVLGVLVENAHTEDVPRVLSSRIIRP